VLAQLETQKAEQGEMFGPEGGVLRGADRFAFTREGEAEAAEARAMEKEITTKARRTGAARKAAATKAAKKDAEEKAAKKADRRESRS
jgi:iron only hydrogenase large subunit-like protein